MFVCLFVLTGAKSKEKRKEEEKVPELGDGTFCSSNKQAAGCQVYWFNVGNHGNVRKSETRRFLDSHSVGNSKFDLCFLVIFNDRWSHDSSCSCPHVIHLRSAKTFPCSGKKNGNKTPEDVNKCD